MKAAHITARGMVDLVDAPAPALRVDHAVVKPQLVSICGSDLKAVYDLEDEHYPLAEGNSGHEVIGVIEAVEYRSKVVFPFEARERVLAVPSPHTGMAEQVLLPVADLVRVPDGVPASQLAVAQPLGTVISGCNKLRGVGGAAVAVVGQGGIGLLFDCMLRRMGARTIVGLDLSEARREAGLRFGAHAAVDPDAAAVGDAVTAALGGRPADIVIEAAGTPEAITLAIDLARPDGILMLFGVPKRDTFPFPYMTWYRKRLHTLGSSVTDGSAKAHYELALNLIARGDIDVSGLVSHEIPLADVARAYDMAHSRSQGALRVAVTMDSAST